LLALLFCQMREQPQLYLHEKLSRGKTGIMR